MAYASITDVEARLGYTLETDTATATTAFMEDYSVWIDAYLGQLTPVPVPPPANLTIVVARHGADFATAYNREGGANVQSLSETVGDVTRYVAYQSGGNGPGWSSFYLSASDRLILGIASVGIGAWTMVRGARP